MVTALGGDQLELQKFQFMISHSFPSITRRQPKQQNKNKLFLKRRVALSKVKYFYVPDTGHRWRRLLERPRPPPPTGTD